MLLSNRSYLKFTLPILYRHLSTIGTQHAYLVNPCRSPSPFPASEPPLPPRQESRQISNVSYTPKRSASIRSPSTDEQTKSSNRDERAPLEFPPGNPNDKPRLEHLRFIEQQLIRIVSSLAVRRISAMYSSCWSSYRASASKCILTHSTRQMSSLRITTKIRPRLWSKNRKETWIGQETCSRLEEPVVMLWHFSGSESNWTSNWWMSLFICWRRRSTKKRTAWKYVGECRVSRINPLLAFSKVGENRKTWAETFVITSSKAPSLYLWSFDMSSFY